MVCLTTSFPNVIWKCAITQNFGSWQTLKSKQSIDEFMVSAYILKPFCAAIDFTSSWFNKENVIGYDLRALNKVFSF